ncbi:hypothetical protein GQ43DRAFT_444787 [Delitschia confertaspora ATCC 74209]|uniref:F-box domain-containing protein n=1 Tax=Delitschia confertaspora ATCC 74209 TaxID=1513339 RepID=A0A9P4JCI7_9PLEO|nr:hypothetical protein GQ43DRAFT_444787 [Delitschia confertaspora ATCC 74209]
MKPSKPPATRRRKRLPPFRFLDLPPELRLKIYELVLISPTTIDLDPSNCVTIAPRLRLFLVSHRVHDEAFRVFYGQNTFRLFPIHGRFYHTKKPLLVRLPAQYLAVVTTLELRLGPGWNGPPRGWVVNDRLGLHNITKLRLLKIFVEFDPASHEVFEGFRVGKEFYTDFCLKLARDVVKRVPTVEEFQFDGWNSVKRSAPLLMALVKEGRELGRRVSWGDEAGWSDKVELKAIDPEQSLEGLVAGLNL